MNKHISYYMKTKISISIAIILISITSIALATTLTQQEKDAANKVYYISGREFFYYKDENEYTIRFCFKDEKENRIAAPCTVKAKLINSDGDEVYSVTKQLSMHNDFSKWTWNSSYFSDRNGIYASIPIKPDEIKRSKSSKGKMLIEVYLDGYFEFSEKEIDVDELPTFESTLKLPSLPKTINYRSISSIRITKISYEFEKRYDNDKANLHILLTGEMTSGSSYTAKSSGIGWRMLDSEGYIIDSGTWFTDNLTTGDKFKNKEFTVYNLDLGSYSLELRDVAR